MKISTFKDYFCPVDLLPLKQKENSYTCPHKHSFDIARKGYVNLLPLQFKSSKNPGDKKDMVQSRTDFLDSGFYSFILDGLYEKVLAHMENTPFKHYNIVDAGCGEGYYSAGLAQKLINSESAKSFSLLAYDISKDAVHAASSRTKEVSWAVATNKRIPVRSGSVDILISMFGFPIFEEFLRVTSRNGILIMVESGPEHLIELRQRIYPEIRERYEEGKFMRADEFFECSERTRCQAELNNLSPKNIADLISMTPHAFRIQKERYDAAVSTSLEKLAADVFITSYLPKNK